jgi:hypothetical protein
MDQICRLKERMAEALVEGILRRAGYTIARVARETQVPTLMWSGHAEFIADFVVWRALDVPSHGWHSYRLLAVEVKYRADLTDYLRRDSPSRSPDAAWQWPELYEIVVTDRPEPGRSCFQVVHVSSLPAGASPVTTDLHLVPGLDVYRRTVEEYEGLVRAIFPIFGSRNGGWKSEGASDAGSAGAAAPWPQKPRARMPGRSAEHDRRQPGPAGHPRGYRSPGPRVQRPGASE